MLRKSLERFLGQMAAATVRRGGFTVVAVTGSVGKSTTKQMIGAVLGAEVGGSGVRVTAKNYNNELGIPLTVFDEKAPGRSPLAWARLLWKGVLMGFGLRTPHIKTLVLEMGADRPGDLGYLCSIAPPNISVITAVTPEGASLAPVHLANYPSIEAVAKEKATLIERLLKKGTAILNADDPRVFDLRHTTDAHVILFGENDAADIRIVSTKVACREEDGKAVPYGLEVAVEGFNRKATIVVPGVFGRPMAYALAAALGVADALDVHVTSVQDALNAFMPLPGRTRIIPGIKHTTLFDDSYNASPASVLSAVRDLALVQLNVGQRRVACLGEMRELGSQSESMHRLVGSEAAKQGIDLLVACGPFAKAMADGALASGMNQEQVHMFEDTPEAGRFLQNWIKPGDVILAKASEGTIKSRGVRMERVVKELMAEPQRAAELLCRQEEAWGRK
jgi:UDP-N-acetylmuramoyl-tripeptide--D-alanyl-D-alanine ligase